MRVDGIASRCLSGGVFLTLEGPEGGLAIRQERSEGEIVQEPPRDFPVLVGPVAEQHGDSGIRRLRRPNLERGRRLAMDVDDPELPGQLSASIHGAARR
jgi:hypothetical protein